MTTNAARVQQQVGTERGGPCNYLHSTLHMRQYASITPDSYTYTHTHTRAGIPQRTCVKAKRSEQRREFGRHDEAPAGLVVLLKHSLDFGDRRLAFVRSQRHAVLLMSAQSKTS